MLHQTVTINTTQVETPNAEAVVEGKPNILLLANGDYLKTGEQTAIVQEYATHSYVQGLLGNDVLVNAKELNYFANGDVGIVLEGIVGTRFDDWVPESLGELVSVFTQLFDWINLRHANGIYNPDLNHGGIIVQPDGKVREIDMGWVWVNNPEAVMTPKVDPFKLWGTTAIANPALLLKPTDELSIEEIKASEVYAFWALLVQKLLNPSLVHVYPAVHIKLPFGRKHLGATYLKLSKTFQAKFPLISGEHFSKYVQPWFANEEIEFLYETIFAQLREFAGNYSYSNLGSTWDHLMVCFDYLLSQEA